MYLSHCGKGEDQRTWIMRKFFCLQLCKSITNKMHKIKLNIDLDGSTEKVSGTDYFNDNN